MRGSKGQVSIEFLIIVGFALLMSISLVIIFFKQSEQLNQDISGAQIDRIAGEIRDSIDEVYYLGSPSKKTLRLYLPENIEGISFSGSSIIFTVSSSSGDYEIVKWSAVNLSSSSSLSPNPGVRLISVEARTYDVLVQGD